MHTEHTAAQRRTLALFLLGGALGALAFLLVYGAAPLDVTNDAFCRGGYIEQGHPAALRRLAVLPAKRARLPAVHRSNINFPDGLSVAYTDSVPLFAALFRLLSPVLRTPSSISAGLRCWRFSCRGRSARF